jgi:tetratricopeptide (TPR) repeat protein
VTPDKNFINTSMLSQAIANFDQDQQPETAESYKNIGNRWLKEGEFVNAASCYQKALEIDPSYVAAYYNLGLTYQRQNQLETAISYYYQALQVEPNNTAVLNNLGLALQNYGQTEEAVSCYQKLLEIEPENATNYYNLGFIFQEQEKLEVARSYYEKALSINPNDLSSLNNLGFVLNELVQPTEAIAVLQKVLAFSSDCAETYINLGIAYVQLDQFTEAIACYQKALELNPNYASAYNNLGVALEAQGNFGQALNSYERAIQTAPQRADYQWNRGLLLLRLGDLKAGFAEHEARWQMPAIAPHSFSQPLWDGTNLQGQRILLHSEGGFGDTLQFIRYVPLVAEQGGSVRIVCYQDLIPLFRQLPKVDQLASWDADLPDFDVHAPMMSLPYLFGTTLDTIPARVPYLQPPDILPFTLTVSSDTYLKVGINWGGNPRYKRDRRRSCSLQQFLPLLKIPQVIFYSLQKGPRALELEQFPGKLPIQNLSTQIQDFSDTAAAIAQLDLIITTDTSVAHLAGALGRPVWVLLDFVPDWRWMLEREDSPWYPTMRLFRQNRPGDWNGVLERVVLALQDFPQ